MRATICVTVEQASEREMVEAWFDRWRPQLTVVSENKGCGCCVDIWDVEGPTEAIADLRPQVRATSEWEGWLKAGGAQ
jgi:hypothetical protein